MSVPILQSANVAAGVPRQLGSFIHKPWAKVATVHVLILATLICRRPQSVFHAQFWAEDGSTFFADQINLGFWHALFAPYAGYLLVVPRLLAGILSLLRVAWIPTAYGTSAIVIATICCSALSWPIFRRLIGSDVLRCLACILMAAAIPTGSELIGSLCDLQWFLAPFALLLLFADWQDADPQSGLASWSGQARKAAEVVSLVSLGLIALTAPVLFVIIPLLVWQLICRRGWQQLRAALVMAALLIQLSVLARAGAGGDHHLNFDSLLISTVAACLAKSILGPLLGRTFLAGSARSIMTKLILTLIVSVNLLTALFIYLGSWYRRAILLAAAYVAVAAVAVAIIGRNLYSAFLYPTYIPLAEGYRYFFVSSCLFVFIAALGADHLISRTTSPALKWLAVGIVGLSFSFGVAHNFRATPMADLSWPYYAAEIEEWEHMQERKQAVVSIQIPLNPPPFAMQLNPRSSH